MASMRDLVSFRGALFMFFFLLALAPKELRAKDVTSPESTETNDDVISNSPTVPITTMTPSSLNQTLQLQQQQQIRRNIIRGSNSAVTITQRKYLKKEMCMSAPLQQVVRHRGCIRRHVVNRFCYGQCNSFFIPKTVPRDYNDEASLDQMAFKSCSFCRPKATRWVRVLLQCPRSPTAKTVRKRVQMVEQCSCTALAIT